MHLCSYNIQYGTGKDGRVDLARIAAEVGEQDVICLQEVERHFSETGTADQAAEIAVHFPRHHWVYGPGVDLDADVLYENGTIHHRRRQFGNMLLARVPILSARNHLLPKHGLIEPLSVQRSALEGVIMTSSGSLRVYSVHLAHASPAERAAQIEALIDLVRQLPSCGGVWSGSRAGAHWTSDGPPPPMPGRAVLMGDFNLTPQDTEYEMLVGPWDAAHDRLTQADGLVDGWVACGHDPSGGKSCVEQARGNRPQRQVRLDYAFLTTDLASSVVAMEVDEQAEGSDHQPIFIELAI